MSSIEKYNQEHQYVAWLYMTSALILIVGGGIYLLMRDKSLVMFRWIESIGLFNILDSIRNSFSTTFCPSWVKYSLPGGLWLSSYMVIMYIVWKQQERILRMVWVLLLPILAILSEVSQIYGIIPGTFDSVDMIFYIIPVLLYLSYEIKH